ncbi:hypothetical protein Taro_019550 [Colocasia esculenta]|uniref:Uncharacterized protein n=1 Tax=Colocasia esculenta TaxID=4460 RepID=A0A843UX29_COLES|nr:hypothetical protein [Colocasia esculenta]
MGQPRHQKIDLAPSSSKWNHLNWWYVPKVIADYSSHSLSYHDLHIHDYHPFYISNEGISLRDFFMKVVPHDFLYELQLESH